jgi:hypothetical protein
MKEKREAEEARQSKQAMARKTHSHSQSKNPTRDAITYCESRV